MPFKKDSRFQFIEKISDKIIRWDRTGPKQNIFVNLSPTLPVIKLQNPKSGDSCSIIHYDAARYIIKCGTGVDTSITNPIDFFNSPLRIILVCGIVISSCFQFCCRDLKNVGDNFKRWPSAWSIVITCIFLRP